MTKLFIYKIKYYCAAICLLTLQSCANFEQYHQQPLIKDIRTSVASDVWTQETNGSLFQEKIPLNYTYQPLFEDHRPHNVGDTVTIVLQENISASNSSFSDLSRDRNSHLGVKIHPGQLSNIFNFNLKDNPTGLDATGKNNFYGKGSNSAANHFTGLITATVHSVLSNGNLQVVGEKQVSINQGTEFIRFSGIINPMNINKNNIIISNKIANARIEYFSRGSINHVQKLGWLQRLLLKISPI